VIKNDLSVRFEIWDFEDITCDDITNSLNLQPFKTYVKGTEIHENSPKKSQRNGWMYGAGYGTGKDFSGQMEDILEVLIPKLNLLKAYSEKYYCEISCALFLNSREESVPWIHLDKSQIIFMKEVNAEFDVDIYYPPLE